MLSAVFKEILPLFGLSSVFVGFLYHFGVAIWACLFKDSLLLPSSSHLVLGLRFWVLVGACLHVGYSWWICSLRVCSSLESEEEKGHFKLKRCWGIGKICTELGSQWGYRKTQSWGFWESQGLRTQIQAPRGHSENTLSLAKVSRLVSFPFSETCS